jgi:hypothetical protein
MGHSITLTDGWAGLTYRLHLRADVDVRELARILDCLDILLVVLALRVARRQHAQVWDAMQCDSMRGQGSHQHRAAGQARGRYIRGMPLGR